VSRRDESRCRALKSGLDYLEQGTASRSKIIKKLLRVTDTEIPQAQEPGKTQPNVQAKSPAKPSRNKQIDDNISAPADTSADFIRQILLIQGRTTCNFPNSR
jgi:hypothetical protein